jgi:hypothetical protein
MVKNLLILFWRWIELETEETIILSTNSENSIDSRSFQSDEITFSQESSGEEIIEDGNSSNFFGTYISDFNQNVNIITAFSIGALVIASSIVALIGILVLVAILVMRIRKKKRRMESSNDEILGLF